MLWRPRTRGDVRVRDEVRPRQLHPREVLARVVQRERESEVPAYEFAFVEWAPIREIHMRMPSATYHAMPAQPPSASEYLHPGLHMSNACGKCTFASRRAHGIVSSTGPTMAAAALKTLPQNPASPFARPRASDAGVLRAHAARRQVRADALAAGTPAAHLGGTSGWNSPGPAVITAASSCSSLSPPLPLRAIALAENVPPLCSGGDADWNAARAEANAPDTTTVAGPLPMADITHTHTL